MGGQEVACPQFLPMSKDDCIVTTMALKFAAHDPDIPLSEIIRKEFFYKCFNSFTTALAAEPALFAA